MTARAFLTTSPAATGGPRLVSVEAAWGADLTDLTAASWTWSDITDDVVWRAQDSNDEASGLRITLGRPDESQQTQHAELICELDNRNGRYSQGGVSPLWPNVRRGTPIRVRVSPDNGSSWSVRFQGQAVGFTPRWDTETGRWATAGLVASGPLRRLNQGTMPATSVYAQTIPTRPDLFPGLLYYWNNEGGNGIDTVNPTVPAVFTPGERLTVVTMYLPQAITPPNTDAFPVSGPLPSQWDFATQPYGSSLPVRASTGTLMFRWMCICTPLDPGGAEWQAMLFFKTSASSTLEWFLEQDKNGGLRMGNGAGYRGIGVAFNVNNRSLYFQLRVFTVGSGATARLDVMDQSGSSVGFIWTGMPGSIGYLTAVNWLGHSINTENQPLVHAHMTVANQDGPWSPGIAPMFRGFPGETTLDRFTRICTVAGIPIVFLNSSVTENTSVTDTQGPQFYDTLTNLLRELELTGQGVLYDGLGPGLTYVTKRRRESNANGAATLTLNGAAGHLMPPFEPEDDDQQVVNHCEVSRRNGGVATWFDTTGPEGTDLVGDYATSWAVNPTTDAGLMDYARWAVHLGTHPGYRYPTVSFSLAENPSLIAGWLACTPQARVDVLNVASVRRQHAGEDLRLLLEGWAETIGPHVWRVEANTSPADPWNVITLAAATGSTGDGVAHLDTDGSQLNANAAAGATSISVRTNTGPRWVTTSEDADSFPFDIDLAGLQVTATAITGTSPQTFTLAAGLPRALTGSTTPGNGAPISVWHPPVLGL